MPLIRRTLDTLRKSLAAEAFEMRLANERFNGALARVERLQEQICDLLAAYSVDDPDMASDLV